jgi:outer membrane lipoprotein SlyB
MRKPTIALALLPLLALGCVTSRTTTRSWGYQDQVPDARYGRIESVRETVQRQEGDPAAGALAGAVVGGVLGSILGGHTHYDRYGYAHSHGSAAGAVVGAVGGAMVGAAASQGGAERRWYEVFVRFDDGALERFVFEGAPPFQVGEAVALTPEGLVRV